MKHMKKILAVALVVTLAMGLAVTAAATENETEADETDAPLATPAQANVYVCGTVEVQEDGRLLVTNPNPEAGYSPIILGARETTRILDAVSLEAVALSDIEDGDWIYAWADPVMALSYPAQAGVQLILVNTPQDYAVPMYHQIVTAQLSEDGSALTILTDKNETFVIGSDCTLSPYLTRNIITLESLVPGTDILVWQAPGEDGGESTVTRVVSFGSSYNGYMSVDTGAGTVSVNGETVDLAGGQVMEIDGDGVQALLVPFRALCEAMGYTVEWDGDSRTATALSVGGAALSVTLGAYEAENAGEACYLTFEPVIRDGRTMVAAQDIARLLGLYYVPQGV